MGAVAHPARKPKKIPPHKEFSGKSKAHAAIKATGKLTNKEISTCTRGFIGGPAAVIFFVPLRA
jgi:hypothetical protein